MGGAGLEGDVKRGAFDTMAAALGVGDSVDFGVGRTGALVVAFADNAVAANEDGADAGVGQGEAGAELGEFECAAEEAEVGGAGHFRVVAVA